MQGMNFTIIIMCLIGLILSVYAFKVEIQYEVDPNFEPMCDISESMSCTKAFMSHYGKGFGLINENSILNQPNSFYGILFYNFIILLVIIGGRYASIFIVIFCVLANSASIYFAYILIFILQDFCIVCVSIYIVNAVLLYVAIKRHMEVLCIEDAKESKCCRRFRRRPKCYDASSVFDYFEQHKYVENPCFRDILEDFNHQ